MPWKGVGGWTPPPIELSDIIIDTDLIMGAYEIHLADDKKIYFGDSDDSSIQYDSAINNLFVDEEGIGTKFGGYVGIGAAPGANLLNLAKTGAAIAIRITGIPDSTSQYTIISCVPTFTPTVTNKGFSGWQISGSISDSGLGVGEEIGNITGFSINPSVLASTRGGKAIVLGRFTPFIMGSFTSLTGLEIAPSVAGFTNTGITYLLKLGNTPTGAGGTYAIHTGTGQVSFGDDLHLRGDDIYLYMGTEPANDYTMRFQGTYGYFDENAVGTRFDGGIGIGDAPAASKGLTILGTETISYDPIYVATTWSPNIAGQSYRAFYLGGGLSGSSTNASAFDGVYLQPISSTYTGLLSRFSCINAAPIWTSAGTVTNAYGFHYDPAKYAGTWTNSYGIKLNNIPAGDTLTYAIHTGTGLVHFGDTLETTKGRIKSTTRITTTYTVLVTDHNIFCNTDGGAFTTTLPVGAEGQHLKLINCGSNTLTVDPDGSEELYGAGAGVAATLAAGEIIDITYNATEGWW